MVENLHSKAITNLDFIPNFRPVEEYICAEGTRKIKRGVLYRSSRPDNLTPDQCQRFDKVGIKCIIDLRRRSEYFQATGEKLLDGSYQALNWIEKEGHYVLLQEKKANQQVVDETQLHVKRKLLISLFSVTLIWHILNQIPFIIRYLSLLIALFDYIFKTHYFVKFVAKIYVNKKDLSEYYHCSLKFAPGPILESLRIISNKNNLPVMINCSQGKDRTGVITMLLLSIAGVSDNDIAHDYGKSEEGLSSIRDDTVREVCGKYGFKEDFTRAYPETILRTIQLIRDSHGSIENYLDSIGYTESDRSNLKQLITEPI